MRWSSPRLKSVLLAGGMLIGAGQLPYLDTVHGQATVSHPLAIGHANVSLRSATQVTISSVSVRPNPATPGGSLTIGANFTASSTLSGTILDADIVNANWNKVGQTYQTGVKLSASTPHTISLSWSIPSTLPAGTYRLVVWAFNSSWSTVYARNANTTFSIGASSGTATTSPTPALPSPTQVASSPTPVPASGFVTRVGSALNLGGRPFRFAGTNIYYLGIDENVGGIAYPTQFRIDDSLQTAKEMGALVVRSHTLGISVGCRQCVEPSLGVFNDTALQHFDYAVMRAGQLGLKLLIPLSDQQAYYEGGRGTFTNWRGLSKTAWFTNGTVIGDFEQYISHIMNHVNTYTGIAYKNDPTIMAWETCNECDNYPDGPASAMISWTSTIAAYIKSIDSHHLVMDGYAWVNANRDLSSPNVDLYTLHGYPMSVANVNTVASSVAGAGKVLIVGEYSWNGYGGTGDSLAAYLSSIEVAPATAGDMFWSLFGHTDNYGYEQHGDGLTLHYPGDNTTMQTQAQQLRTHAYTMRGQAVPSNGLPPAPVITGITVSGSSRALAWRGSVGAATYSVQVSTAGSGGPFTTRCAQCTNDNGTPWTDTVTSTAAPAWYRVIPYNRAGVAGTASSAVQG
jgi:mannan endo-1,4-beta-mannosidase